MAVVHCMLIIALTSSMSSTIYTAGSVAQLLATEPPASGKVTKLQALFSKPAAQSPVSKRQKVIVSIML